MPKTVCKVRLDTGPCSGISQGCHVQGIRGCSRWGRDVLHQSGIGKRGRLSLFVLIFTSSKLDLSTMYIYIDESGIFANPTGKKHSVSCVAALVMPEQYQKYIFKRFKHLKVSWGIGSGEPKGSKLNEEQIAYVISILNDYDVFVTACGIDIGIHTDDQITTHKQRQTENITKHVTPEHHPNLVRQLEELRERYYQLSNQLYAQSVLLTVLVQSVIQIATLYYCQRNPFTLSCFRWVIDAKDDNLTNYEDIWSSVVMPFCESKSLSNPIAFLEGGDYSWFDRKFNADMATAPKHLQPFIKKERQNEPFHAFDAKKVLSENRSFKSSDKNLGLQLADIIVNAIRRALHGNLKINGWGNLGRLMVSPEKGHNAMQMVAMHHEAIPNPLPYGHVIKHFDKISKPMLDEKFLKKIEQ